LYGDEPGPNSISCSSENRALGENLEAAALPLGNDMTAGGEGALRAKPTPQSQEAALAALAAISSCLDSDENLPEFFGRLSATVADLTGAKRAAFWRLGPRGVFALQPSPHGFARGSAVYSARLQMGSRGEGIIERVVFAEELELAKGTSPALDALWRDVGLTEVNTSIAASWRAGNRHVGAVAVYDARHGFTSRDLWMLRLAGMAAGLVWQHKKSEIDLSRTAVRLEQTMAARRQLFNNIAAGGDEARRRFASALHDDSLQLLTGAELQLERIKGSGDGAQAAQLAELSTTLIKVEDSLRRLLIDVSPEPLQLPDDLGTAISERLESMRIRAGIEPHIDSRLPADIPQAIQAIVLKNIVEALNNVEKHARATKVTVVAEGVDGGVRVEVSDDGTGFVAAESARIPGHIGLVAMRERAQLAGGWCHVASDPGAGTKVEFWIPLSV
jgi:signal transduction histidine kinase